MNGNVTFAKVLTASNLKLNLSHMIIWMSAKITGNIIQAKKERKKEKRIFQYLNKSFFPIIASSYLSSRKTNIISWIELSFLLQMEDTQSNAKKYG